jgi:hypothetical protein
MYLLVVFPKALVLITLFSGTADASTKLSAILWKEARANPKIYHGWHFEHNVAGIGREAIGFGSEVKDIKAEDKQPTLYLIPNKSVGISFTSIGVC